MKVLITCLLALTIVSNTHANETIRCKISNGSTPFPGPDLDVSIELGAKLKTFALQNEINTPGEFQIGIGAFKVLPALGGGYRLVTQISAVGEPRVSAQSHSFSDAPSFRGQLFFSDLTGKDESSNARGMMNVITYRCKSEAELL